MSGNGDYISREAVKQIIAAQCGECADACLEFDGIQPDCNQCLLGGVAKAIKTIPAADVRPVVLCRDCEYYCKDADGYEMCDNSEGYDHVSEDGFCAWGKKREES